MNCQQFENRVQRLLDERANLLLDIKLQQHARDCEDCRSALSIYDCFSTLSTGPVSLDHSAKSGAEVQPQSASVGYGKGNQSTVVCNRLLLVAAALIFLMTILAPRPVDPPTVLNFPDRDRPGQSIANTVKPGSQPTSPVGGDLSQWILPQWSSGLTQVGNMDLTSIDHSDLVWLLPEESAKGVMNLPASIGRIEPLYRYSNDLPIVNQWSSSIHYTIGLLQQSLNRSSSRRSKDLGRRPVNDSDVVT